MIRIIGDSDNQRLDKWSSTVLQISSRSDNNLTICLPHSQPFFKTISGSWKKYGVCFNENDTSWDKVNPCYLISQSGPFSDVSVKNRWAGINYISSILSDLILIWNSQASNRSILTESLIFVVPCIMLYSGEISPTRCNNCVFFSAMVFTLHVSGDNLTHHQEYNAVYGHR